MTIDATGRMGAGILKDRYCNDQKHEPFRSICQKKHDPIRRMGITETLF